MAYRKLNVTVRDEVDMAKDYKDGWSLKEIADHHEIAINTVRRRLVSMGVELRPRGRPEGSQHIGKLTFADRSDIVAMYKVGYTTRQLAWMYKVTKERICQLCRAAGVIDSRGRRELHRSDRAKAVCLLSNGFSTNEVSRMLKLNKKRVAAWKGHHCSK